MMTFRDLDSIIEHGLTAFSEGNPLTELSIGAYASMAYPEFPPLMRFRVRMFAVSGFGNVCVMHTKAMGMMQLATLVFTPNLGGSVPLLLVDVMALGKKRAAFVEYYDATRDGAHTPLLTAVAAAYQGLPNYPEKSAWYVAERTPYSLIKGGIDDEMLCQMLADAFAAYGKTVAACGEHNERNLAGLQAFINRMAAEGNPSDATMTKVLGADGAKRFFTTVVMPQTYQNTNLKKEGN